MERASKLSSSGIFLLFLTVNLIASTVNHIDDTDETYGYWEPLHYLLYGDGMQTWEYSPHYAIRTYSFIYPLYLIGSVLKAQSIDKITIFYLIRAILGIFTAASQTAFVISIGKVFSSTEGLMTMLFLVCSPGVFFSSTSYLPSAFTMSCVMNSCAAFLTNSYSLCVLWGSIAVLWSGWPFVAVLFVPLGLYMVIATSQLKKKPTDGINFTGVIALIFKVIVIITVTLIPAVLLDKHYYQKWTSPPLNILLYNAIGGSGDELYGIEPASYYVKNLFLNTGLAWLLTIAAPFIAIIEYCSQPSAYFNATSMKKFTVVSLAIVWFGILFSRPHKEERFMYPVYPILALIASSSICSTGNTSITVLSYLREKANKKDGKNEKSGKRVTWFASLLYVSVSVVSFLLLSSRVTSNYNNYNGYFGLWKQTNVLASLFAKLSKRPVNVCTGSEWYLFPSHFFLPDNVQLQYVDDGFKGVLPQHFHPINGTSAEPLQPFNDLNKEERSRYVTAEYCDFLVVLVDHNKPVEDHEGVRKQIADKQDVIWMMSSDSRKFIVAGVDKVISQEYSTSSLGRAFYIPGYSDKKVKFKNYYLLKQIS